MASTGEVEVDALFLGLTRPPMLFGVSYTFAGINFFIVMLAFVGANQGLKTFLILPIVHLIGYYFSQKEPLFMELYFVTKQRCSKCKNRLYHGLTNSYDVA